jgi:hypothetical protein
MRLLYISNRRLKIGRFEIANSVHQVRGMFAESMCCVSDTFLVTVVAAAPLVFSPVKFEGSNCDRLPANSPLICSVILLGGTSYVLVLLYFSGFTWVTAGVLLDKTDSVSEADRSLSIGSRLQVSFMLVPFVAPLSVLHSLSNSNQSCEWASKIRCLKFLARETYPENRICIAYNEDFGVVKLLFATFIGSLRSLLSQRRSLLKGKGMYVNLHQTNHDDPR